MSKKTRQRPSKPWFLVGGIGLGIVFLFLVISLVFLQTNQTKGTANTVGAKPTTNFEGSAGGQGTPEYNAKMNQLREQEGQKALETGETYLPPIIGNQPSEELLDDLIETEKPQEEPEAVISAAPMTSQYNAKPQISAAEAKEQLLREYRTQRASVLKKAMMDEMGRISQSMVLAPHKTVVSKVASTTSASSSAGSQGVSDPEAALPEADEKLPIMVGDVLYAVVDQFLDSDSPVPAFRGTVVSGKFKGSTLIGQFTRTGQSLSLSFRLLRTPQDELYSIEAYAVDPESTDGRLASSVDNHTISRWTGVIAAGLLKGWQSAVQDSGTDVAVSDGTTVQSSPDYSFIDELIVASGEVGGLLSEKALEYFDREPTVQLFQGFPVGVVILDAKRQ